MSGIQRLRTGWHHLNDHINPIVVRELRQAVRGRFITIGLMLFLMVMLTAEAVTMSDNISGKELAEIVLSILAVVCLILIPILFGVRSALERERENMDLLFVSTLSPRRIVTGKLVSSAMVSLLFICAATPFLTLTYFLRGVDVLSILMLIGLLFWLTVFVLQAAIFVGSMPTPLFMKLLLGVGFVFWTFAICGISFALFSEVLNSGWHSFYQGRGGNGLLIGLLIGSGLCVGLFLINTSFFKSPYHNPTFAPRLYFLLLSLVFLAAGAFKLRPNDFEPVVFLVLLIGLGGFAVGMCESEDHHRRLLSNLPQSTLKRLLLFPFYGGPMPALVWSWLVCGTAIVAVVAHNNFRWNDSFFETALGSVWYFQFYGLLAFGLRRRLFGNSFSQRWNWLFAMVLCGFGMFLPWTLGVMFSSGNDLLEHSLVFVLNPFGLDNYRHRDFLLAISGLLCTMVTAAQVGTLTRTLRAFKAPEPEKATCSFPPPRRGR